MKKDTEKVANIPSYIGHNSPPKDIEPIEFTNTAVKAVKVEELNFNKTKLWFYLSRYKSSTSSPIIYRIRFQQTQNHDP